MTRTARTTGGTSDTGVAPAEQQARAHGIPVTSCPTDGGWTAQ